MNEWIFFFHALVVVGFLLLALWMGKEALIGWIALTSVTANLFVLKQIEFFGWTITCSDVFSVGALLGFALLKEYFGEREVHSALQISFFCLIFFTIMAQIHLIYLPSPFDWAHSSFSSLLSLSPRITTASFTSFFLSQIIVVRCFSFLRKNGSFPLALTVSLGIGELGDTLFFSCLGLWGLVHALLPIMVISFVVKCCAIGLSTPLISLVHRWHPPKVDHGVFSI